MLREVATKGNWVIDLKDIEQGFKEDMTINVPAGDTNCRLRKCIVSTV